MENNKIDNLLEQVTAGLDADLEVRLDVTNELRSHFDDKVEECRASGMSDGESEEAALKHFGETIQVADGLIEANVSRMKLKARLRKMAWIILVPAVILCVVQQLGSWNGVSVLQLMTGDSEIWNYAEKNRDNDRWFKNKRYTDEEKLILFGDRSRKTRVEQQYALVEKYPDNKMYRANYIMHMLAFNKKDRNARQKVLKALKDAERVDPDNALYNYLTAGILLDQASTLDSKKTGIKEKTKKYTRYKYEYTLKVKDPELMKQAVHEYLKGTRKKYYKTYIMSLFKKRLEIIGEPITVVQCIRQIAFAASTLLPNESYKRSVARCMWLYAVQLQKTGQDAEALKIADSWKTYLRQISQNSPFLISVLVDYAIAGLAEKEIPGIYRKAGKMKLATQTESDLKSITAIISNWKERRKTEGISEEILKKSGLLATMLLPAVGMHSKFKEEDFEVSSKIEYTIAEEGLLLVLNQIFFFSIIGALLTALYWRFRTKRKALLLAPPLKLIGKAFLSAICLPLMAYLIISLLGGIGGHRYNCAISMANLAAQFALLLLIIPSILFIQTRQYVRQRCIDLDVPVPELKKHLLKKILIWGSLLIFSVIALIPAEMFSTKNQVSPYCLVCVMIIAALLVIIFVVFIIQYFSMRKSYALYYGALARAWVPVLALAMIFMTLFVGPYLDWRQASLIKQDKIIYGKAASFTGLEAAVTKDLNDQMRKELNK